MANIQFKDEILMSFGDINLRVRGMQFVFMATPKMLHEFSLPGVSIYLINRILTCAVSV